MERERAMKLYQTFRLMGITPAPGGRVTLRSPAGVYYLEGDDDTAQVIVVGPLPSRFSASRFAVGEEIVPGYRVKEDAPLPPAPGESRKARRAIARRGFRSLILVPT